VDGASKLLPKQIAIMASGFIPRETGLGKDCTKLITEENFLESK
jgi:hypothetical protein